MDKLRKPAPEIALAVIVLCVVLASVYSEYLFGPRLFLFRDIGSDTVTYFWPHFTELSRNLHEGGLTRWSFYQGLGQNLFGYHGDLLNFLLYACPTQSIPFNVVYLELGKSLLCGLIVWSLMKEYGWPQLIRLTGSVLFVCSSQLIVSGTLYIHSTETLYTLLAVYGTELFLRRGNCFVVPLAGGLVTAVIPFYIFHVSVISAAYALARYAVLHGRLMPLRPFACLAALFAVGFGLSAVFSFEGLALATESARMSGGESSTRQLLSQPIFGLVDLKQLGTVFFRALGHDLLGNGVQFTGWSNYLEAPSIYVGLLPLILIPQLYVGANPVKRVVLSLIIAAVGIIVIVPFARYAYWLFLADYYRALSIHLALTILLLGAAALYRISSRGVFNRPLLWATIAIPAIILASPLGNHAVPFHRWAALLLLITYGLILHFGVGSDRRRTIFLLCALAMAEAAVLSHCCLKDRWSLEREDVAGTEGFNDGTAEAVASARTRIQDFFRVYKYYSSAPVFHHSFNEAKLQNYFGLSSYLSFNQKNYHRFLTELDIEQPSQDGARRWLHIPFNRLFIHALVGARIVLTKAPAPALEAAGHREVGRVGNVHIYENPHALPLAVVYDACLAVDEFRKLRTSEKERAIFRACIVESPDVTEVAGRLRTLDPLPVGSALIAELARERRSEPFTLQSFEQNRIVGQVTVPAHRMLVFSIPFDRGWKAKLNGQAVDLRVVNCGFTGLQIPAGSHSIELSYRPPLLTYGIGVSALSALVLAGLVVARGTAKRRGPTPQSS